jgi:hypothetical protein
VPLAAVVSVAKLGEHSVYGRFAETVTAEVSDDSGLPTAIDTPPAVPLEAEHSQPPVDRVVTALGGIAAAHVMFTLARDPVRLARSAAGQLRAASGRARTEYPRTLRNSL